MCHISGAGEVHTGFWRGDPRQGDHLEDLVLDGTIILSEPIKEAQGFHVFDYMGILLRGVCVVWTFVVLG
jgi:hypothetical protein